MELDKVSIPDLSKPGLRNEEKLSMLADCLVDLEKKTRYALNNIELSNLTEETVSTFTLGQQTSDASSSGSAAAASAANTAAAAENTAAAAANTAAAAAISAASDANTAVAVANSAVEIARDIAAQIDNMTVSAVIGNKVDAEISEVNGVKHITFTIPLNGSDTEIEPYTGEYEVTPKVDAQTLPTALKTMADDVTVFGIPYFETSNESAGTTVYIGTEVEIYGD